MAAPDTRVFGVHLADLMNRPNERTIPTLIKKIIRYLNSQGLGKKLKIQFIKIHSIDILLFSAIHTEVIFRISAKPKDLAALKQKIDAGIKLKTINYFLDNF